MTFDAVVGGMVIAAPVVGGDAVSEGGEVLDVAGVLARDGGGTTCVVALARGASEWPAGADEEHPVAATQAAPARRAPTARPSHAFSGTCTA